MARLHLKQIARADLAPLVVVLNKPVLAFPSVELMQHLSWPAQLKGLYKKMFRLRHVIDHRTEYQLLYCDMLRRRFSHNNYQTRRKMLLGIDEPIGQDQLQRRLVSTYAFLYNATVQPEGPSLPSPVVHQSDLVHVDRRRPEKSVVLTILTMDQQMPNEWKLDHSYKWVPQVKAMTRALDENPLKRQQRKIAADMHPHAVGYRDHEVTVMRLNELMGLCL